MRKIISVLIILQVLASCATTVTVKTTPTNAGVSIIYEGKERGVGEATFETGSSIFADALLTFQKGGEMVTQQRMERRFSVGYFLLGYVSLFVTWLWIAPFKETQIVDLAPFLKNRPGYVAQPVLTGFTDTVTLKNGQVFAGVKAAVTADSIVMTTRDGKTLVFGKADVQSIKKGN